MASKRRGGLRPPELRGTLGTILRTTTGVVRDAIERGAREGRARLDDVRARSRRQDALVELGELVLDLIRRGEIDLAELPEARALVRQLDELDDGDGARDDADPPRTITRRRFDDRGPIDDRSRDNRSRPDERARLDDRSRYDGSRQADDGTVSAIGSHTNSRSSSSARATTENGDAAAADANAAPAAASASPPADRDRTSTSRLPLSPRPASTSRPIVVPKPNAESASTRAPTKPIKGIWRPLIEDAPTIPERPDIRRPQLPLDPHRKGGISFDDDLDDYMHPDDVPPKPPPGDPDDNDG